MTLLDRCIAAVLALLLLLGCSARPKPPSVTYATPMPVTRPSGVTDAAPTPTTRPAEYHKGQTLRLRVDAFVYKFNEVHHPAEAGLQITVPKSSNLDDATARADWERSHASQLFVARLPVGTVFRFERIQYVSTLDTAILVPYAVVVEGPQRGQIISLYGVSIEFGSSYPYQVAPNPTLLEVDPAK